MKAGKQESRKADLEITKIAENLINNITRLDTHESAALQHEVQRTLNTQQSETLLIVGNKGSGKSTFIRRFFRKVLPGFLRAQCTLIVADLEEYHGSRDDVSTWLLRTLREKAEKAIITNDPPSFDDLRGVFWEEYKRWRNGSYKHLYETDRNSFYTEFGRHIERLRQSELDTYVKLLLSRSMMANRRLPCIILDNTDQFSMSVQDQVYQLAHSLGVSTPVLTLVPITDRTIWQHRKVGALQSYSARTFYLPVPDAKEIIARRVSFVQSKLNDDPEAAHAYFSARGFSVGVSDLKIIAQAIERVLVQQDYVSGLIGRLSNFNIKRMLQLAQQLFVSPEIRIDDIVKAHFSNRPITADRYRTYRAIIKGDYDRFSEDRNDFVSNMFFSDPKRPTSPLLGLCILLILRMRLVSTLESSDDAHIICQQLADLLEVIGSPQDSSLECLQRLNKRGLIEEFDLNTDIIELGSRVVIKEAGIAHIDLTFSSSTYLEQMALCTGLNDRQTREQMKDLLRRPNRQAFFDIRNLFLSYILRDDAIKVTIPSSPDFAILREARNRLRSLQSEMH